MGNCNPVFNNCCCAQNSNSTDILLTKDRDDRRSALRMQTTQSKINRRKKSLKDAFSNNFKNMFISPEEANAQKIQKVYRGYNYRAKIYPEQKEKLKVMNSEFIESLNKKYITPEIKCCEKLFDLKNSNILLKDFYQKKFDFLAFTKEKTTDRTNTNVVNNLRSQILAREYNGLPSYYIGQLNEYNEPHGEGTIYIDGGYKYEGSFFNGEFFGLGKYINNVGICYEGNFIGGFLNGLGVKIISNEHFYMGNFKDFLCHGFGREESPEYIYEGEYVEDKRSGKGKIIFKSDSNQNGDTYEGDFLDDNITGIGKYTWENGQTYIGSFLNGKMHGKGTYTWIDGNSYEGEYANGIKEGFGKFTFNDGKIFIGNFKNGNPDGKGKCIINGLEVDVEYKNGKMVENLKDSFFKKYRRNSQTDKSQSE